MKNEMTCYYIGFKIMILLLLFVILAIVDFILPKPNGHARSQKIYNKLLEEFEDDFLD